MQYNLMLEKLNEDKDTFEPLEALNRWALNKR